MYEWGALEPEVVDDLVTDVFRLRDISAESRHVLDKIIRSFCFYVISSWLEYNKRLTSSVRYLSDHDKTGTTAYRTDKKKN